MSPPYSPPRLIHIFPCQTSQDLASIRKVVDDLNVDGARANPPQPPLPEDFVRFQLMRPARENAVRA